MADYQYINSTGVIVADTQGILGEVHGEYKDAFGQDLIVTADTPQGVLITGETISRAEMVQNNAVLANQINPNVAGGIFLDAICPLTGIEREIATRTVVAVQVTGVPNTIIPEGSLAATAAGDQFESLGAIALALDGTGSGTFRSVEYGPIPCGAGELDQIVSGVLGWETITNAVAGTLGVGTQSDMQLRAYRRNTLAFQGVSIPEAITSALYATEGVKSLTFRENIEATTETIDGVSMAPKSLFACVDGGADIAVAAAILENKSSGSKPLGTTVIPTVEPASGQTYSVRFYRPEIVNILIKATIKRGMMSDVRSAIMAYVNGELEGEDGFVVGASVSPFEIAGAVNINFPTIYVKKIEISLDDPISWTTDEIAIGVLQQALTNEASITVIVE